MKYCPECGQKIEDIRKYCPECGFKFSSQTTLNETIPTIDDTIKQEKQIQPPQKISKSGKKSHIDGLGVSLFIIGIMLLIIGIGVCFVQEYWGGYFLVNPYIPHGITLIIFSIIIFIYGVYRITKRKQN